MAFVHQPITAVIDAQGYFINHKFYPREFSFSCNLFHVCYEVIPEIDDQLKADNYKSFIYQKNNLHGIPIDPVLNKSSYGAIKQEYLREFVIFLYSQVKHHGDNSKVAIKNYQLIELLQPLPFPIFDLTTKSIDEEYCPTLEVLDKFPATYFCPLHSRIYHHSKYRCAARKTQAIWNWIKLKQTCAQKFDDFDVFYTLRLNTNTTETDSVRATPEMFLSGEDTVF